MVKLLRDSVHEEQHREPERMCIWKQWKLPKTRKRKLMGLGLPEWGPAKGHTVGNLIGRCPM